MPLDVSIDAWMARASQVDPKGLILPAAKHIIPWVEIPDEFKSPYHPWSRFISRWFFEGVFVSDLEPKDGVHLELAIPLLMETMYSMRPSHQHKIASCAYLCSLLFEEPPRADDGN